MEETVHLPNGHLLNFPTRSRNGKRPRPSPDAINHILRDEPTKRTTEQSTHSYGEDISQPHTPEATGRKTTPTRLPLKVFVDKDCTPSKGNSAASGHQERGVGVRVQPKNSDAALDRESPRATDKEREQYWRKVRDKLDKDRRLPLSPRNKEKQQKDYYHEAYRKIISLASSPRQEIAKHKLKHLGIAATGKGISKPGDKLEKLAKTPSLGHRSVLGEGSQSDSEGHSIMLRRGRRGSERSALPGTNETTSQKSPGKTENTTHSSDNSRSSISPVSGPATSMTEWEDRFVVNMPSAREPNPPTMNAHQIAEFQKSIEKVHKEGGAMLDPETLPSPRTTTPEQSNPFGPRERRLGTFDGQDSRPPLSNEEDEAHSRRYYCPDEVGRPRCSTIWEESSMVPKQKSPQANADGSFLGCREINGPNNRNPDEILLFSTVDERPKVVNIPPQTSRTPREPKLVATQHMTAALEGKTVVQEEWKPISQNLKHAQCSKPLPKTMCHEVQCQQSERTEKSTKGPRKENIELSARKTMSFEQQRPQINPDDVYIITPTITRTMVTMTDIKGHLRKTQRPPEPSSRSAGEIITDSRTKLRINTKPQTSVSPSGLRRASQNSWERSNVPSAIPSRKTPTTNTPTARHLPEPEIVIEKPRVMRGYIRTPGIVRSSTETLIAPVASSTPKPPPIHGPATIAGSLPLMKNTMGSPLLGTSRPESRITSAPSTIQDHPESRRILREAKVVEVAELDGQQVEDPREATPNIKPTGPDLDLRDHKMQADAKGIIRLESLNLIIDMVLVFTAQAHGFYGQIKANRRSKSVLLKLFLNGILGMLEHCLHVARNILAVVSTYNATGDWPKTNDKDLARSLAEIGQAMVYLVVLGFIMMIVGRAAGYVVLIGSWVVWFARPFALVFATVGRALLV
ncbi:hypothetical protein P175DRAFT_0462166 [Aspergillus ochraceoroseus IBT 24754]|uniref:NTP binding protein n=3 Tax=Aspergillus subgen. Nidulantes TaxID=2720870 RepID=A0A0F8WVY0_9EURO|nr:uncharacterized protein P175DRAFT_0462166 [Aspergillus ochraceoroseus IBT 24754]KKK17407.1 hypothetical protein AOCH_006073 [Aspergillus ochraceoroseus]KKK21705.1 hypothetical protein ARAM_005336 [Aspergillus rambellii]PTU19392.1 hypothetical protein P175DRAFT_0462166 [Aspergillus ochraceoroseus IBT 24754]